MDLHELSTDRARPISLGKGMGWEQDPGGLVKAEEEGKRGQKTASAHLPYKGGFSCSTKAKYE